MACENMEEAIREQQIAVTMMRNNDYMGARGKLIKAKNCFPSLENIVEMITVCDILCTAEFGLPGCGTDWYWILQTNMGADVSQIEFKYKSLMNRLVPIKNKFPGTESALNLIRNAYCVLSDRERRSEFDEKRAGCWGPNDTVKQRQASHPALVNKGRDSTSQNSSGSKRIGSECSDKSNGACDSREQPLKREKYLDRDDLQVTAEIQVIDKLTEKICKHGVEKSSGCPSRSLSSSIKPLVSKEPDIVFYDFDKNRKAEVFAVGQIWAAYDQERMPRKYARINSVENSPFKLYITWLKPAPVNADERKWLEVGLPVSCGYFKLDRFQMDRSNVVVGGRPVFSHLFSLEVTPVHLTMNQPLEIHPKKGEIWAVYRDWKPYEWCKNPEKRKGCGFQIVEILTGYSKNSGVRVAWLVKVAGFRSIFQRRKGNGTESSSQISAANLFIFSHSIPAFRFTGGEMDLVSDGMIELDPFSVPEDVVVDTVTAKPQLIEVSPSHDSDFKHLPSRSPPITSEPQISSLKPKWSPGDFTSGQIWAIYDGLDSMPRRYAIVHNVVSVSEVCVTYLKPQPKLEDEIHWVERGLPFVCGSFETGITKLKLGVSQFSHLMECDNGEKTRFHRIYPKKGEIWAMYKNWNTEWKHSNFNRYRYRVVEILSDYSENTEIRIASLVEVKDQKTFFQRQLFDGFELVRTVSTKEMLSFSHQIPAFIVPGSKIHGIPDGSWHLEPDALPPMFTS